MDCKEAMLSVIRRQVEGVMYHNEMVDYYTFLNLNVLKTVHKKQTKEELSNLQKTKSNFIKIFGILPVYTATDPKVIPTDWEMKTTKDIDELSLRLLIESSLNDYLDWEEQTCEVYKNAACILKDNLHFLLYRKVCSLVEEVENEKQEVKNLIAEATTYDYNPTYFK